MKEKLLFDTDIGSDIDDAVCLAYLLSLPKCELLGITTVSGEPVKRAMLASALCKVAGKEIPIYPGTETPLLTSQRQPDCPQAAALARWEHETDFPRGGAVEFLRGTIRANPGEVTLLAVGPLTNVALLFAADPEIPGLLKRLVLMCGVFTNGLAHVGPLEWNALCDPYATAIVYRAAAPVHRSVGLDVTCRVAMEKNEVLERFTAKILRPVADFAGVWFERAGRVTFHDPLAAAAVFDEGICRFERGNVEVELLSERMKGLTYWQPGEGGRHEAALGVDAERFFRHYFSVVEGAGA